VTFLTEQLAAGSEEADWRSFATSGATLVIYMPQPLGRVAAKLKQAGFDDAKPCALVSRATLADEQIRVTTLANLACASGLSSPSLLIVGEVVRFAPRELAPFVDLAWGQFPISPSLPAGAEAMK
jgi:siroheme synthase